MGYHSESLLPERSPSSPISPSMATDALQNYKFVMETPTFVQKIYKLVESGQEDIIGWNPEGDKFIVYDSNRLESELLHLYFNTSNFSSFVRQMHFYGFSKTTISATQVEFRHPYFIRGHPNMLPLIVRKTDEKGSAQRRHIQELEQRIKELEEENAKLQASVEEMKQTAKNLADDENVMHGGFVKVHKTQRRESEMKSQSPSSLLTKPTEDNHNIPFSGQKRFRPTILQSQSA